MTLCNNRYFAIVQLNLIHTCLSLLRVICEVSYCLLCTVYFYLSDVPYFNLSLM